ncbi:MAG TPA: tRNA lysidine(34) synthetase TilS [Candidatus Sulfotelmatobacter sp.]|nr:tRNA lysidine(34) synthetase TilS [Candidatus Sulfotelmatobacter sp.]
MHTQLEQHVLSAIRDSRTLIPGDRVAVAVSGGADSVALLRLLESLRGELGITLSVAHFDHSLRGAESSADAEFVRELAQRSGHEFMLEHQDVAAAAREHGWNLEDASRRLRYAFFQRLVNEGRATRVAVAHTADDQAETLIAHLIRGTGPTGLGGIHPVVGAMVRPLLGVRRRELREYLNSRGESWREDSTNRDLSRTRARIREQLLPMIERDFSPAIVSHLCDLARFAREEETFWNELVEDRYRACAKSGPCEVKIAIHDLLFPLPLTRSQKEAADEGTVPAAFRALTERLIRRLYEGVRGELRGLSSRHVEHVIHLATRSASGHRIELPGGISVERAFGDLIFSAAAAESEATQSGGTWSQAEAYQYIVSLPRRGAATVSIPELGSCIRLKVIDWPGTQRDTKSDGEALDADLLRNPLILRNWRPGDAYRPRGRRQPRKLKEMFLAGRVPSRERARWPVLECDGRVIWARGMPPAEEFCAREGTRAGVVIEEDRL